MLNKLNYSLLFLSILIGRATYKGCAIGDSIAIIALAGLYGYGLYLESKKIEPLRDGFRQELDTLKSSIDSLKIARTFGRN